MPFLMDIGSRNKFISANWVKTLRLKSYSIKNFPMIGASDKELVITRRCSLIGMKIEWSCFPSWFLGVVLCSVFKLWDKFDGIVREMEEVN